MIKKSALKECFESLIKSQNVHTSFGVFPSVSISIRIVAVGRSFVVALYKTFIFDGALVDNLCAKSFPMSYKSAHRLVCSL